MGIPYKDSLLAPFAGNFSTRVSASAATFGFSSTQATALAAVVDGYQAALTALDNARNSGDRSKSLVMAKDDSRFAMLTTLRAMYGAVQTSSTVADSNKALLGVTVRRPPSPVPPPLVVPSLEVVGVDGRVVKVRIHDAAGTGKRSKPPGVKAAAVCTAVGPVAPSDPTAYKWEGSTTKSTFVIEFPESVVPGTLVHITAMWLNAKQQSGPACVPVSAQIQFGGTFQQAA
jgi:hypothetical protein